MENIQFVPASPRQIRFLEARGFRHVVDWSFEEAKNMIDRIADNGWRVPRGIVPAQYEPKGTGGNCVTATGPLPPVACNPLILPPEIIEMLRGQVGYTENSADIAELGIGFYEEGKSGADLWLPELQGITTPWVRKVVEMFCQACWEQGRKDAAEATA